MVSFVLEDPADSVRSENSVGVDPCRRNNVTELRPVSAKSNNRGKVERRAGVFDCAQLSPDRIERSPRWPAAIKPLLKQEKQCEKEASRQDRPPVSTYAAAGAPRGTLALAAAASPAGGALLAAAAGTAAGPAAATAARNPGFWICCIIILTCPAGKR